MQIRRWELLYALLNSWIKGLLWFIPVLISIFAVRLASDSPFITWEAVIFFVILFALFAYLNFSIETRINLLKASLEEVIDMLKADRNNKIDAILARGPRDFPDGGQVNLREYIRAIESIRAHGFLEFDLDLPSLAKVSYSEPLSIHSVVPGMSKYFMVGTQNKEKQGYAFIILPAVGIDSRDFTVTWFENIFQILGHSSRNISELHTGFPIDAELSGECFFISKFRFIKRRNKFKLRIFI